MKHTDEPAHFGQWLKMKLKMNGVLQKDLAKQICVSTNTVTSWTRGDREPSVRNFAWICKYLSILENCDHHEIITEAMEFFC
tara:strand:+ start:1296 stop:1541 length:246 start_codon:yes stop_codon:yes gene_type:complete